MTIEITIKDNNGNIVVSQSGPVETPLEWKATYNSPIVIERPNTQGAYLLFGFVYQPRTTLNLQWRKPL